MTQPAHSREGKAKSVTEMSPSELEAYLAEARAAVQLFEQLRPQLEHQVDEALAQAATIRQQAETQARELLAQARAEAEELHGEARPFEADALPDEDAPAVVDRADVLRLLRDTQAQLVDKAASAATWQARAEFLAGELQSARQALAALQGGVYPPASALPGTEPAASDQPATEPAPAQAEPPAESMPVVATPLAPATSPVVSEAAPRSEGPVAYDKAETPAQRRSGVGLMGYVLRVVLVLIVLGALALGILLLFRWQLVSVLDGSMAPPLDPGSLAFAQPVSASLLQPGDLVVVPQRNADSSPTVRRVVASTVLNSQRVLQVQATNEALPESPPTVLGAEAGRVAFWIPLLGYPAGLLQSTVARLVLAGIAVVILVFLFTAGSRAPDGVGVA